MVATSTNRIITPSFARKSTKVRPVALPIMILGGSPMSVAVPPILDARICVSI